MKRMLCSVALAVLGLVLFLHGISLVEESTGAEGAKQLERALRQAAVACYAEEGGYPPNVDYLCRHYGVLIDERYTVVYENFADNLMPNILILEGG